MPPIDSNSNYYDLDSVAAPTGVTQDSRAVKAGDIFVALQGGKVDGRAYIDIAIQNGASAILAQRGSVNPQTLTVPLIESDNPRRSLSLLAAQFSPQQPSHVVAVGGTNGKSSTVHFLRQLWESEGFHAASIGTLGIDGDVKTKLRGASMTTPDPIALHEALASLAGEGVTHLAIESSSHGLDQYRLDGMRINIGAFTSFSRDHMDYHGSEEAYFAAKKRQFSELMLRGSMAVLNADIAEFSALREVCNQAGHTILSYGHKGADIRIENIETRSNAQVLTLVVLGQAQGIVLPLAGHFQAMNALCALGCVIASAPDDIERALRITKNLAFLKAVPGRLQRVGEREDKVVYVDYAHTPDALENVLNAVRPHTKNKLFCLFGCGGDRDAGKRPLMGQIAARLADEVIITDDNPRSEDAKGIREQIMQGACAVSKNIQEIENRRSAINSALAQIGSGDVLVVAGKGHEQGQIFNGYTEPFDDVEEVLKAILKTVNA